MRVGIDLGTSYSSISILNKDGKPEPVHVSTGMSVYGDNYSLPSAVYIEQGKIIVGQAAIQSRMRKPENFKSEFKRDLGQHIPYTIGEIQLLPQDLYKELFIHMKNCAEKYSGEIVDSACITHPANYNSYKKELIISAAKAAGILQVDLLDEPTAAALYYYHGKTIENDSTLLVYDFGGGTFDVSLIQYKNGNFETITQPLGVENCGGIDIDRTIFNDILTNIQQDKIEILKQNPLNLQRFKVKLNEISVKAKHHLSYAENFSEDIEIGFDYVNYSLSQQRLNSMIVDLVEETIFCTNRIIQNAGINHSDIDTFLLVGGTSRMPLVRQRLETYNSSKIQSNVNPELAVSMGAAFSLSNSIDPKLSNAINLLISSILEYRNCVNCGRKIKMNNKFCQYCGKPNFSYRKM